MRPIHVVVPDGIDDPARPSGGNTYDRRLCEALEESGRTVVVHPVPGPWPRPDAAAFLALGDAVRRVPDGATVLVDGLVASTAPDVLVPQARRLRMIVLVHMQLGGAGDDEVRRREGAVFAAASDVVATSDWARQRLLRTYDLPGERVHIAEPGADPADLAAGTPAGGALLCVAAVIPAKGHDVLVDALERIGDRAWSCICAGSLDRDPAFAAEVRRAVDARVTFAGALAATALARRYAEADLVVLPSRAESYGMVVTEALARGLPVVAGDVGGVPEALGASADGARPGLLVPPGDAAALAAALAGWLDDAGLRSRLRRAAAERRGSLPTWASTATVIGGLAG